MKGPLKVYNSWMLPEVITIVGARCIVVFTATGAPFQEQHLWESTYKGHYRNHSPTPPGQWQKLREEHGKPRHSYRDSEVLN